VIRHLEINGFKSLRKVSLDLEALNIFIGTNASGKSNFFDALRVLQGIGYGFTVDEIFNGKPRGATSEVWAGIRGGSENAAFRHHEKVSFRVELTDGEMDRPLKYSITFLPAAGIVAQEALHWGDTPIFESAPSGRSVGLWVRYYHPERQPVDLPFPLDRPVSRELLKSAECAGTHKDLLASCSILLSDAQSLDPAPEVLRGYATSPTARRMGERGENFPAIVAAVMKKQATADAYSAWLKELTPVEFDEVLTVPGALKEPLFAFRLNRETYPAPVLSDGTLRFAALAAAFFQLDLPRMLMIEEIEDGIHPSRLRLLVELLRSQAGRPQVMATTHSPLVLAWLNDNDYRSTFFCRKDEESGASIITPLSAEPKLLEIVKKQPLSELFAEGWLENAL